MKRTLILIALVVIVSSTVKSQVFAKAGGNYLFHQNDYGATFNALGAEIGAGYYFSESFSGSLGLQRILHPGIYNPDIKYWDAKASVSYDVYTLKPFVFYLSGGVGYFWKKYDPDVNIAPPEDGEEFESPEDEQFLSWFPEVGFRIPLGVTKLQLDISAGYYFFPEAQGRADGWFNFQGGVQYQL